MTSIASNSGKKAFLLGLDYELYFGPRTGSVEKCILEPTETAATLMEKHGFFLSLFVDAGYLVRCKALASFHPQLARDYDLVCRQLENMVARGHDVQLHVHPHWEDASYSEDAWHLPVHRYRLHDFSATETQTIVSGYKSQLSNIAGRDIFAYRAGGWCMQPFATIAPALASAGVWMDSTVYADGYSEDPHHGYDFRGAPTDDCYRFSNDPNVRDENGEFVEIPITPCTLGPDFFWRLAISRKLKLAQHQGFGDGAPIPSSGGYYLRKLTRSSVSVASVDGLKSNWLARTLRNETQVAERSRFFNAMGHPKAMTPGSMVQLDKFLQQHSSELEPCTFWDLKDLKPDLS
ncbi:MAG: hypothetical protein AAF385_03305 [Pseudomonadota bacterium]